MRCVSLDRLTELKITTPDGYEVIVRFIKTKLYEGRPSGVVVGVEAEQAVRLTRQKPPPSWNTRHHEATA